MIVVFMHTNDHSLKKAGRIAANLSSFPEDLRGLQSSCDCGLFSDDSSSLFERSTVSQDVVNRIHLNMSCFLLRRRRFLPQSIDN